MYIERNGEKFELTRDELLAAYEEVQKEHIINDIVSSFESLFLNEENDVSFQEFFDDLNEINGYPEGKNLNVYHELADLYGKENISFIIKHSDEFLDSVSERYNKDFDANADYNIQIENAIFSVLQGGIFNKQLAGIKDALDNGALVPDTMGFEFDDVWIVNPFYDETYIKEVDPIDYYGSENIVGFLNKFNNANFNDYIKDELWKEVSKFDNSSLKAFMNSGSASLTVRSLDNMFNIIVFADVAEEKGVYNDITAKPCYSFAVREVGSEDDIVTLFTTDLSREGFNACMDSILSEFDNIKEQQLKVSEQQEKRFENKEVYREALADYFLLVDRVRFSRGMEFEALCRDLDGVNFDGELFDVAWGKLGATIHCIDGEFSVNEHSVDVLDLSKNASGYYLEESISVQELINICAELGFDVDEIKNVKSVFELYDGFYVQALADYYELQNIVENFEGTLDELVAKLKSPELVDKLQGHDIEVSEYGNFFDLPFGVLDITVGQNSDGKFWIATEDIEIWDGNYEINNGLTFNHLVGICKELGVDVDAIKDKNIYAQAVTDFYKLEKFVDSFKGDFGDLCIELGGHNFKDESWLTGPVFDLNYGVLTVTVYKHDDGYCYVSPDSVDIWNDSKDCMIKEGLHFDSLVHICTDIGINVEEIKQNVQSNYGKVDLEALNLETEFVFKSAINSQPVERYILGAIDSSGCGYYLGDCGNLIRAEDVQWNCADKLTADGTLVFDELGAFGLYRLEWWNEVPECLEAFKSPDTVFLTDEMRNVAMDMIKERTPHEMAVAEDWKVRYVAASLGHAFDELVNDEHPDVRALALENRKNLLGEIKSIESHGTVDSLISNAAKRSNKSIEMTDKSNVEKGDKDDYSKE